MLKKKTQCYLYSTLNLVLYIDVKIYTLLNRCTFEKGMADGLMR